MDDEHPALVVSTAHDLQQHGDAAVMSDLHEGEGETGDCPGQDATEDGPSPTSDVDLAWNDGDGANAERERVLLALQEPGEGYSGLIEAATSEAAETQVGNQPHEALEETATQNDEPERGGADIRYEESVLPVEAEVVGAVADIDERLVGIEAPNAGMEGSSGSTTTIQLAEAAIHFITTDTHQAEQRAVPVQLTKSPPALFVLCLRSIARHIKAFYNMRLYPPSAPPLSKVFEQAMCPFDLSTLYLLEDQQCFQRIAAMKVAQHNRKRDKCSSAQEGSRREHVPLYALETDIKDHPPAQLASVLGMDALTQFPLRVPNNSDPQARRLRARRRRWKMDTENRVPAPENDSADEANAGKKTRAMQRELKLSRQEVTNIGCGYLATLLQGQSSLVDLSLQNCQITCAGAIILANAIKGSKALRRLDLSNNDTKAFRGETFDNEIRDVGASALASALERNRTLVCLSLTSNPVGTSGGIAIAKMLQKNTSLRRLELSKTRVEAAALELIQAFERSTTLEVLNLQWCALRPGLGSQLAKIQAAKSSRQPHQRS